MLESLLSKDPIIKELLKKNNSKRVVGGFKAKKQGEEFEQHFKSILDDISGDPISPIVCYRKHSNEVVGALAKKNMFGLIKKLGYLKGDLDYSVTLRNGATVFIECKSGKATLTDEQESIIKLYIKNKIPFFVFCEKLDKKLREIEEHCILASAFKVQNKKAILEKFKSFIRD